MFAASTWFAAGQPPPARPGQAGRWAAGRSRPATVVSVISDGDRLACAGRTYALPSARWELLLTCRPGNNALPVCTVTARHGTGITEVLAKDAPGRTGHGHLIGRHIAAGLPTASSWFTGGLPAGRPGGTDPLGRLRAVSAPFAGTSSAPSVDARRGRLAGGAAGLAPALRIRCGISPAPAWRSAAVPRCRCLTSAAASVISTKTLRNIIPLDRTGFP